MQSISRNLEDVFDLPRLAFLNLDGEIRGQIQQTCDCVIREGGFHQSIPAFGRSAQQQRHSSAQQTLPTKPVSFSRLSLPYDTRSCTYHYLGPAPIINMADFRFCLPG